MNQLIAEGGGGDATGVDSSGLIHPLNFAYRSTQLRISGLGEAADQLRRMGKSVASGTEDVGSSWTGLPAGYEAPEQERVYALMDPVVADGEAIGSNLGAAADELDAYALVLVGLKNDLIDLEDRAGRFRDEVINGVWAPVAEEDSWTGTVMSAAASSPVSALYGVAAAVGLTPYTTIPWDEHGPTVEKNAEFVVEHAELISRFMQTAVESHGQIQKLLPEDLKIEVAAPSADQLLDPTSPDSWGPPVEEKMNIAEQYNAGWKNFIVNTVSDSANLAGFDTENGWAWSSGHATRSRFEMAYGLASLAVVVGARDHLIQNPVPGHTDENIPNWLRQMEITGTGALFSMMNLDYYAAMNGADSAWRYRRNPLAAGTESFLNVASIFASGGRAGALVGLRGLRMGRPGRGGSLESFDLDAGRADTDIQPTTTELLRPDGSINIETIKDNIGLNERTPDTDHRSSQANERPAGDANTHSRPEGEP